MGALGGAFASLIIVAVVLFVQFLRRSFGGPKTGGGLRPGEIVRIDWRKDLYGIIESVEREGAYVRLDANKKPKWYRVKNLVPVDLGDEPGALNCAMAAADRGVPEVQFQLGCLYADGQGVPQQYAEAVKWFRLAAEDGLPNAQYRLAHMYAVGKGVPQDYVQAHAWFNLAGAKPDLNWSREDLDRAKGSRDELEQLMTPEQIADAQKLAGEWHKFKAHDPRLLS